MDCSQYCFSKTTLKVLSSKMSTDPSIGWMMNGIEQRPIRVGANLLTFFNWSSSKTIFFSPSPSSSSSAPMILDESLTTYPMMFPGISTEAKHYQIRQSSPVMKTYGDIMLPSLTYWSIPLLTASAKQ